MLHVSRARIAVRGIMRARLDCNVTVRSCQIHLRLSCPYAIQCVCRLPSQLVPVGCVAWVCAYRQLTGISEDIVTALVCQMYEGIRDHLVQVSASSCL